MTGTRRLQVFPVLWLTVIWVLLWGDVTVANALSGLVVSVAVLTVFPLPRLIVGVRVRPVRLVLLALRFLGDVVVASMQVAWFAVRPRPVPRSSVVTVPLRSRNELFQTVVGEMMSLVPGSLVVDLDVDSGRLSMHVLNVETPRDADVFRAQVLDLESRVLAALAADPRKEVA